MSGGSTTNLLPTSLGDVNDCRKKSGLTCSFVVFAALNVAMMVVGIKAVDSCPVDQMIPNYLIGETGRYSVTMS